MCGISGIWKFNGKVTEPMLRRFNNTMVHRGPDGEGYFISQNEELGLAHRRLSILDLTENGKQPQSLADGRYWITYNGEIYNFIELKNELALLGYGFKTDSDTEVILAGYHKWGKDCLHKFNGMWAFAIWDEEHKKLFMARDRFGVKPMNFCYRPGEFFAFASETIAFKELEGFKREIDPTTFSWLVQSPDSIESHGYTIFKNIFQLLPGHCLELTRDEKPAQKRWWNTLKELPKVPQRWEEQVEQFSELFEDACKMRLRSDVPVASALSGGVDSSAVYCMLYQIAKSGKLSERTPTDWQHAFVETFPGSKVDEKKFAEEVIAYTSGKVTYVTPNYNNLISEIESTTKLFDGIAMSPIMALTDVYRAMRENDIKVSLDGHGVDEMLYGYKALVSAAYVDHLVNGDNTSAEDIRQTFGDLYFPEEKEAAMNELAQRGKRSRDSYISIQPGPLKKTVKTLLKSFLPTNNTISSPTFSDLLIRPTQQEMNQLTNEAYDMGKLSYSELLLFHDFHLGQLPYNLRDFDRASMQQSIEIRMPFMDYRLVSFVFALPLKSKVGRGYTKTILREAMKGKMPESIRTRKLKIGFGAPFSEWMNDKIGSWVQDEFSSTSFQQSPYWDGKKVLEHVEEHNKARDWTPANSQLIWNILNAHILLKN